VVVATVRVEPRSSALDLAWALDVRRSACVLTLKPLAAEAASVMVVACRPQATGRELLEVVEAAEGVPLLIEELLAAPGLPRSLADSVSMRLAALESAERAVVYTAAVLGRQFDWRQLPPAGHASPETSARALEAAIAAQLVEVVGDGYQFRHALTRDAVLASLLPHERARLASRALHALTQAEKKGAEPELAADLAVQAGDSDLAVKLLTAAAGAAIRCGALATAIETAQRAVEVAPNGEAQGSARRVLVEALAAAGRVDDCLDAGESLLGTSELSGHARVDLHLLLAHSAVEAGRGLTASGHLESAQRILDFAPEPSLTQRHTLLAAEVALADRRPRQCQHLVEAVLAESDLPSDVRCHALVLLGRSQRTHDLDVAATSFAAALAEAERGPSLLWQLRALHELGTIELFDHAGLDRLIQARRTAEALGVMATSCVLDIQLAAAHLFRFEPQDVLTHARLALVVAERLRLDQLRATALVFIAEAHGLLGEAEEMERHNARALAAAPRDPEITGSVWGARGVAALLSGDPASAVPALRRAHIVLDALPNAGPAIYRGLLPLLLAVRGDESADEVAAAVRAGGAMVNRANRGLLAWTAAVLAGRGADTQHAETLAQTAQDQLAAFGAWADVARLLAAETALRDGWGEPRAWLLHARPTLEAAGLHTLVAQSAALLVTSPLAALGVTRREREVLALVAAGLSNKEVAKQLSLSVRTVEKHVESLLRKTGTRSRVQLATAALTT
jgi:DNA-binding CsgD family transcriptional regulator/tetratricopeptide (TPR) repeat protein